LFSAQANSPVMVTLFRAHAAPPPPPATSPFTIIPMNRVPLLLPATCVSAKIPFVGDAPSLAI
jgi:hypothetical protein